MKLNMFRALSLSFLLLFVIDLRIEAGQIIDPLNCERVGRVLRSDDHAIKAGAALCKGEQIKVGVSKKVYVSCFDRSANQWISGTNSVDHLCSAQKEMRGSCWFNPGCTNQNEMRALCWYSDCIRPSNSLTILTPQASAVKELSRVEWLPIENAEYYEVFLTGGDRKYTMRTTQAEFEIPAEFPLNPGGAYLFEIVAVGKDSILSKSVLSFLLLSEEAIEEITNTRLLIDQMPVASYEKILLTDSLYISNGMFDASINYLETQPKTPVVAQLLAYRYAEVGDAVKARVNYDLLVQFTAENSEEYDFAQKVLNRKAALECESKRIGGIDSEPSN